MLKGYYKSILSMSAPGSKAGLSNKQPQGQMWPPV